jgi:hypothetical protein
LLKGSRYGKRVFSLMDVTTPGNRLEIYQVCGRLTKFITIPR